MVFCLAGVMMETDMIAGEKPPEVVQAESVMLKQFHAADPEVKGQIKPEESVRKSLEVIGRLDAKTSGLLLSHNGNRGTWL